jgi:hypothetical protein
LVVGALTVVGMVVVAVVVVLVVDGIAVVVVPRVVLVVVSRGTARCDVNPGDVRAEAIATPIVRTTSAPRTAQGLHCFLGTVYRLRQRRFCSGGRTRTPTISIQPRPSSPQESR